MTELFDWAAAQAAKEEGMDRAERGANPAWSVAMLAFTKQVAETQALFTSDDVFRLAYAAGLAAGTRDLRAFGPVMMRAAKSGICCKAPVPPINSERTTLHGSPRTVWRSLIHK